MTPSLHHPAAGYTCWGCDGPNQHRWNSKNNDDTCCYEADHSGCRCGAGGDSPLMKILKCQISDTLGKHNKPYCAINLALQFYDMSHDGEVKKIIISSYHC